MFSFSLENYLGTFLLIAMQDINHDHAFPRSWSSFQWGKEEIEDFGTVVYSFQEGQWILKRIE